MDIFKFARRAILRFHFLKRIFNAIFGRNATDKVRLFYVKKIIGVRSEPYELEGSKMFLDPDDSLAITIENSYEPFVTEIVKQELRPGDTAIDVGANIGYYTLLFSRLVGSNGRVFAFEPTPYIFELLNKNVALNNYTNVTTIKKGVADKVGFKRFAVNRQFPVNNSFFNISENCDFLDIETTSLDAIFGDKNNRVDFIKMDIEGGEHLALEGMRRTLDNNRHIKMIVEYSPPVLHTISRTEPQDLLDLIWSLGFSIYDINSRIRKVVPVTSKKSLWKYETFLADYTNLLLKRPV